MENYFARLLLANELDDPITFAKVQQEIAELEKKRIAQFNEYGPLNPTYVTLLGELNMAYLKARDTSNELESAQQIYQSAEALYGKTDDRTIEALIALASSYLDDGQIDEAQGIVTTLLAMDWAEEKGPSYDLYLDTLATQADIHHAKEDFIQELKLRTQVWKTLEEFNGTASVQTMLARLAVGICLEHLKRYAEALDHYLVIRAFLDAEPEFANDAEKIGLMAHIARCLRKTGRLEDSRVAYRWASDEAVNKFGHSSAIAQKMKKIVDLTQNH